MKWGGPALAEVHGFTATLFTTEGKGGWTFAPLPAELELPVTGAWGMTPVVASVDGLTWNTTIWRDTKNQRTLLPVPKKIRRNKGHGDSVQVTLRLDDERITGPRHPVE